jgi:uncharacterized protein YkwD
MDLVRTRRRWSAAIALLVAGLLLIGLAPARSEAAARTGRRMHLVGLTNEDREARHRHDLGFAAVLSHYAKHHSRAMARRGYIFHSTQEQLLHALDGYDWSIGGENVGVGGSLESLEDAFMASKPHRENILRKAFDHVAVGIVRRNDALWVTVIFYG